MLVLGAGASNPYGFPLGKELVDLILKHLGSSGTNLRVILAQQGLNDVGKFVEDLRYSGTTSIDAFLEGRGDSHPYVRIGKIAIAHSILLRENRDSLFEERPCHWYRYLWDQLIRPGASTITLPENRLAFITFNYDLTLEYYLTRAMQHSFGVTWDEAHDLFGRSFSVIHVHGEVGEDPSYFGARSNPLASIEVANAAQQIRIVHDPVAEDDSRFQEARQLIGGAQIVSFIGFGYHPENLRRLDLKKSLLSNAYVNMGTYMMGGAEISRAHSRMGTDRVADARHEWDALAFIRNVQIAN